MRGDKLGKQEEEDAQGPTHIPGGAEAAPLQPWRYSGGEWRENSPSAQSSGADLLQGWLFSWEMGRKSGEARGELLVEAIASRGCCAQALTKAVAAQSGTQASLFLTRASQSGFVLGVLAVGELRGGVTGALKEPP